MSLDNGFPSVSWGSRERASSPFVDSGSIDNARSMRPSRLVSREHEICLLRTLFWTSGLSILIHTIISSVAILLPSTTHKTQHIPGKVWEKHKGVSACKNASFCAQSCRIGTKTIGLCRTLNRAKNEAAKWAQDYHDMYHDMHSHYLEKTQWDSTSDSRRIALCKIREKSRNTLNPASATLNYYAPA